MSLQTGVQPDSMNMSFYVYFKALIIAISNKCLLKVATVRRETCQRYKIETNKNSWKMLTIFAKNFTLDVWQGSEYAYIHSHYKTVALQYGGNYYDNSRCNLRKT